MNKEDFWDKIMDLVDDGECDYDDDAINDDGSLAFDSILNFKKSFTVYLKNGKVIRNLKGVIYDGCDLIDFKYRLNCENIDHIEYDEKDAETQKESTTPSNEIPLEPVGIWQQSDDKELQDGFFNNFNIF